MALSRHPDAAGTAAALLGAAQFGLGAVIAPLVGVLGNDEFALALVMMVGSVIALAAMLFVGASSGPAHAARGARGAPRRSATRWPNRLSASRPGRDRL